MVLILPPRRRSCTVASIRYPISRRHFSILIPDLTTRLGYFPVIYPYASAAMKLLFSSILSAASRSLLLSTRLLGLRIDAVAVNFLNPFGDNVASKMLLAPALLGVNFTYNFSLLLAPILNPSIDAAGLLAGSYASSSPK